MPRKKTIAPGVIEVKPGVWVVDGMELQITPYCDCEKKGFGFTQRDDGAWVRPCCMRRERAAWEVWGDAPTPSDVALQKKAKRKAARERSRARLATKPERVSHHD